MLLYNELAVSPADTTSSTYVGFGLSLDVPSNGGLVDLKARVPFPYNDTNGKAVTIAIYEDASTAVGGVDTEIEEAGIGWTASAGANIGLPIVVEAPVRPPPGRHTYKIMWKAVGGGTAKCVLSATSRARLSARL